MALDIHRKRYNESIFVAGTLNTISSESIEWDKRITFYQDEEKGKVVFAFPEPPEKVPFVSFPKYIILESRFAKFNIMKWERRINYFSEWIDIIDPMDEAGIIILELTELAQKYELSGSTDFYVFPEQSMRILEEFDVPLVQVNMRLAEIFGTEQRIINRIIPNRIVKQFEYKKINIGPIVYGWSYRLGNVMPNSDPKSYLTKTDMEGNPQVVKIRGAEENANRDKLRMKMREMLDHKSSIEIDKMSLEKLILSSSRKMDKLQLLYEKAEKLLRIVDNPEIDDENAEVERASNKNIIKKIYDELEDTQNGMIVEQTELFRTEDVLQKLDVEIVEIESNIRKEEDKLSDYLIKIYDQTNPDLKRDG